MSAKDESLLESWKIYDLLEPYGARYTSFGVFRPSCIIKSIFQCPKLTGDNIGTLIASLGGILPRIQEWREERSLQYVQGTNARLIQTIH